MYRRIKEKLHDIEDESIAIVLVVGIFVAISGFVASSIFTFMPTNVFDSTMRNISTIVGIAGLVLVIVDLVVFAMKL